jgi:hypothetical protein
MNSDIATIDRTGLLGDVQPRPRAGTALRPRLIPIDAAADYMGVGRSKFWRDYLPRVRTVQVGRRRLVELDSVDALINELAARPVW